jgi:hypothetical protein
MIHLDAHAREITVADIRNQIYTQLERDGRSPHTGYFPFQSGNFRSGTAKQQHFRSRSNDFRDEIMAGLQPTPPLDKNDCMKIKQVLTDDVESQLQIYSELAAQTGNVHPGSLVAQMKQQGLDRLVPESLTEQNMRDYASVLIRARLRQLLDDDIINGLLVVNVRNGRPVVYLDHLVVWATERKITIDQDALPGCEPFIQESYRKCHQKIMASPQPVTPLQEKKAVATVDWKLKAGKIADEIGLRRWNSGQREITGRNICDAVAVELEDDPSTHGIRGPRSPEGVRQALIAIGWKFKSPAKSGGSSGSSGSSQ